LNLGIAFALGFVAAPFWAGVSELDLPFIAFISGILGVAQNFER